MTPIEKAAGMNEREMLAFVKTDRISKQDLGILINDLAQKQRARGESREVAYTRFICDDVFGKELFAVHQAAAGPDYAQQAAIEKHLAAPAAEVRKSVTLGVIDPLPEGISASKALGSLVTIVSRQHGLTTAEAFAKICETPGGKALARQVQAED